MAKFKVGDRVRIKKKYEFGIDMPEGVIDYITATSVGTFVGSKQQFMFISDYWDLCETFHDVLATNDKNKLFRYLKDHLNA